MVLSINTDALVQHAARLERMSRSALPVVVRQTLNAAAFNVKTVTMPQSSDVFIHRKATFFKANSKVQQAQGFDINSMQSIVGFIPKSDAKDTSVADLEQQEDGGKISGRAFVPLKDDRVGNSWQGNVKAKGRYRAIESKIVDAKKSNAGEPAQQFLASAKYAGVGGVVIGNRLTAGGNKIAWRITGLKPLKMIPLFAVKAHRNVMPHATHFMQEASNKSAADMGHNFIMYAEKKFDSIK